MVKLHANCAKTAANSLKQLGRTQLLHGRTRLALSFYQPIAQVSPPHTLLVQTYNCTSINWYTKKYNSLPRYSLSEWVSLRGCPSALQLMQTMKKEEDKEGKKHTKDSGTCQVREDCQTVRWLAGKLDEFSEWTDNMTIHLSKGKNYGAEPIEMKATMLKKTSNNAWQIMEIMLKLCVENLKIIQKVNTCIQAKWLAESW